MASTNPPYRDDDDDERLAGWGERSEGFILKYLPYVVGVAAAMGILFWGAVPQFRDAGLVSASAGVDASVDLAAKVNAKEFGLGYDKVSASAQGSTITLNGTVPSEDARTKALAAAAAVPGVTAVIDKLTVAGAAVVTPSPSPSMVVPSPSPSPSAVPSPSASPSAVAAPAAATVTASEAGVVLAGTVASTEVKDMLVAAAEKAYPGKVTNNLTVSGVAQGATVTYSGAVTQTAADALRGALAGLRGAGAEVKDDMVVGAGVGDSLNDLVTAEPILFDTGKSTLRPASVATLTKAAAILKANTSIKVEIQGHTDSQGSATANRKLSQQRADAVMTFLAKQGVTADQMTAKGYGSTQPVAPNNNEKNRQLNRRIAFAER